MQALTLRNIFSVKIYILQNENKAKVKWKVSRDWGELQMIPVDSLKVLVLPGHIYIHFKQRFHVSIFKKEEIAVRYLAITSHMRSDTAGDFLFLRTITI